jgi:sugar lactone lactonase YvrE
MPRRPSEADVAAERSEQTKVQRTIVVISLGLIAAMAYSQEDQTKVEAKGVIASSTQIPNLVLPEGITSSRDHLYVGTYNVFTPGASRVFVLNTKGELINEIGGEPGQELVASGALLGLTIDKRTGDLYVAANSNSQILRIQNPDHDAKVTLYAQLPAGAGPEDLNFGPDGRLYSSDSNLGLVWSVAYGGGKPVIEIGPSGSGARHSDKGLFASALQGLSPNGIVFSADWRHFFVANTYQDSIVVFDVNASGRISSDGRPFAKFPNPDLELYPNNFTGLFGPNTRLGFSASTPVNGPDGLALDAEGNLWVASILGDNLAVLDPKDGHVIRTLGSSAESSNGFLNMPAGMTFIGSRVYNANLGLFADGTNGNPLLPFTVTSQDAFTTGFGGNGNH